MTAELISGYFIGKAVDIVLEQTYGALIHRWSSYRAKQYFQSFLAAIAEESSKTGVSIGLTDLLQKCDSNDEISSVLFDAYRRVALCTSREIGPRIIGILTAQIVLNERSADEYEERIFMAAESLSDSEFLDFEVTLESWLAKLSEPTDDVVSRNGLLVVKQHSEQLDSNSQNREADMSPINLAEALGLWALKLKNTGILWERNTERTWSYREDSERKIFEDGSVRESTWYIEMPLQYLPMAQLIAKVRSMLETA